MLDKDLRDFLLTLHKENKDEIRRLDKSIQDGSFVINTRMDVIANNLVEHEKSDLRILSGIQLRLQSLETVIGSFKWISRVGIVAILGLGANLIYNIIVHWK